MIEGSRRKRLDRPTSEDVVDRFGDQPGSVGSGQGSGVLSEELRQLVANPRVDVFRGKIQVLEFRSHGLQERLMDLPPEIREWISDEGVIDVSCIVTS